SVMTALSPPELISLIGSCATGLPPETWRNHSGRAVLSPLALTRAAAFAAAPSQPVLHERADARERGTRFRQHAHQQMPDVPHAPRDLELHVAAGGAPLLGHPRSIVAQHVVAAHMAGFDSDPAWIAHCSVLRTRTPALNFPSRRRTPSMEGSARILRLTPTRV